MSECKPPRYGRHLMEIIKIDDDKKRFLPLLLLGDEQESMIDRYLERGDLYAMYDGGLKCVCVVADENDGVLDSNFIRAPIPISP